MNSETPRTDAEVFEAVCAPGPSFAQVFDVVKAEYARTLERDLAAARADLLEYARHKANCTRCRVCHRTLWSNKSSRKKRAAGERP